MKRTLCAVLSLLSLAGLALPQDSQNWRKQLTSDATFGAIRRLFLNQRVVIVGHIITLNESVLFDWTVARKNNDGRYENSIMDKLSSAYHGKTATVIAVQLKESRVGPNALGEIIQEDGVVNPFFELVVRFDDGTVAMCSSYPNTVDLDATLATEAAALAEQMSRQLPLLVGQSIYAVGYSKLYKPDTTLDEMTGVGVLQRRIAATDMPLLVPLKVLAAKHIDSTGVVFKLKLPNGSEALSFVDENLIETTLQIEKMTFFGAVVAGFLTEIPKTMTQREVEAIRHGTIYRGMSKNAVDDLLGFPEKENDWGLGGKQLIYYQGDLLVYLDRNEKVDNWQSLSKK